ncbi:MAG: type II secretion system protein [Desulfobacteraceae bacterium]|nr:MAG: type II secretion system protein [Desulfobacteraceae bacterium]
MSTNKRNSGFTLIEAMATIAIISILAVGVMPMSKMIYQRKKELELRQNLRVIRNALDKYEALVDQGTIPKSTLSGYPPNLETLVEGVALNDVAGSKKKFLRRVPKDPMTEEGKWGLRSYNDEPTSSVWGGQDVYDVYSLSEGTAIDGTFYREW